MSNSHTPSGNEHPSAGGDDERLAALAAAGDRIAFDRLVIAYRNRIMTLCIRLLGDYHEGEDAAQETFVRAYHGLKSFEGKAQFGTWIHRIAVNTCRNRQRSWWTRLSKSAVRLDRPIQTEDGYADRELGDTRMTPAKDLERHRTVAALRAALASLPSRQRELIVLRDIQDLSYEEISAICGIASGTVKSRIARARESLRSHLSNKMGTVWQ